MKVIGYTYPDGFALCLNCAMDEADPDSAYAPEEIHPIFDTDEQDNSCDNCLEVIE